VFTKHLTLQCLEKLIHVTWPCYITGCDLINIDWASLLAPQNSADTCLQNFAVNNGFMQMVTAATRGNSILDVVFTNEPNTVYDVTVDPHFASSDHCCIKFTIFLEDGSSGTPHNDDTTRKQYLWDHADYEGLANYLSSYNWSKLFTVNLTANSMWSAFYNVLLNAIDAFVPSRISTTKKTVKRYPKKARKVLARKRCLWRKLRINPNDVTLHLKYQDAGCCENMKLQKRN